MHTIQTVVILQVKQIVLRPQVGFAQIADLPCQRRGALACAHTPAPVVFHGAGGIDAALAAQAQIILELGDKVLGDAALPRPEDGLTDGILAAGRAILGIPAEEVTGGRYIAVYTVAQVLQWICAVLFAFFTNKKWVFTDADKAVSTGKQLVTFAGSRLVTFGLDFVITYAGTFALAKLFPTLVSVFLLGKERNLAEILSKVIAAIVVIICNYIISKVLVFKKSKSEEKPIE